MNLDYTVHAVYTKSNQTPLSDTVLLLAAAMGIVPSLHTRKVSYVVQVITSQSVC